MFKDHITLALHQILKGSSQDNKINALIFDNNLDTSSMYTHMECNINQQ